MIARAWWPLQRLVARHFLLCCVAAIIVLIAAAIANRPRPELLPSLAVAAGAVLALLVGSPLAGVAVLLVSALACSLAPGGCAPYVALAVVMAVPAAVIVAGGSTHGPARAAGYACVSGQLVLVALAMQDKGSIAAVLVLIAAAALLPMIAASTATDDRHWSDLAPLPVKRIGTGMRLALGLLLVAGSAWSARRLWPIDRSVAITAIASIVLWRLSSGRWRPAAATALGALVGLGIADCAPFGRSMGFALGQCLPLLLWAWRDESPTWRLWMPIATVVLPCLALPDTAATLATTAFATVAARAALGTGDARPVTDGDGARQRRRAFGRLEPYWRYYGRSKLRFDPIYARLASDDRVWGNVLDLGCGPGLAASIAATRDDTTRYCGIDLDRDKLLAARRLLAALGRDLSTDWRLVQGRLPWSGPPSSDRADTVLLIDVLHYWPRSTQAVMLRQARQALAGQGRLYLRDGVTQQGSAGAVGLGERFTTFFGLNPAGGLHFLGEDAMLVLLGECGFAVEACEECGGANRLWICRGAVSAGEQP